MNLIEIFRRLGPEEKHVCFFWSKTEDGWKRRLAWNPVAKFTDLKQAPEGKSLMGYISYEGEQNFFAYDSWLEEDYALTSEIEVILARELSEESLDLNFQPEMSRDYYNEAFKKVKDYIVAGDIYQMNLTLRFSSPFDGDSKFLFSKLIEKNPVNFMAYLDVSEDLQILSASPERFIHTKAEMIHTYPIKGTVARGITPEEDEQQRQNLLNSEKEAAELNMITDLLRNDLGRISKPGSVKVLEHRVARPFPSIWHTYSHIVGELAVTPIEALISMFPGGSITGCPKIRAMEIIDELEPHKRGIYTGAIGIIEPNGDIDFNIVIRTLIKEKNSLYLQVGGGLVYDSDLDSEWEEVFNKAQPFLNL
ncbi:MAG: para-aminobenzoate synthetase component 1 [Oceanicoccus sp.]|jgi:para-aminobenzoate synthetase component 1